MPTVPPSTTSPPTAPARTSPSTFAIRADAWVGWLEVYAAEVDALAANVYANAVEAHEDAVAAAASQVAAAASQAAAAISAASAAEFAGASVWVSGTTYIAGDAVYSPLDFRVYRRISGGGGTTDPSADGANWALVSALPPTSAATKGKDLINDGSEVTWGDRGLTAASLFYAGI